jgi:hypothetical protein
MGGPCADRQVRSGKGKNSRKGMSNERTRATLKKFAPAQMQWTLKAAEEHARERHAWSLHALASHH